MKSVNTHRATRWVALAAAAAVCASTLVVAGSASASVTTGPDLGRFAGADRFATAALINNQVAVGPVAGVFTPAGSALCDYAISDGREFADALSGAVLGRAVLLTETGALPAATIAALETIKKVCGAANDPVSGVVLGGESAVSSAVFEALFAYGSVTRIAGDNRYETSLAVAADACGASVAVPAPGCADVIIATGLSPADALAAAALATANGTPIILHDGSVLRGDVKAFLKANTSLSNVFVVGGTAAIPAQVSADLVSDLGVTVTPLAGANRYATAATIAGLTASPAGVILVNGDDTSFSDALAIGQRSAFLGFPVLLINGCSLPSETAAYLAANSSTILEIIAAGGTAVVCDEVMLEAKTAATYAAPSIVSATVAVSDIENAEYTSAVVATATGEMTFTGKTGGAAAGLAGNGWTITLVETGAASVTFASPNPATPTNPKSISISGPIGATSAAAMVTAFNGSPLGAIFVADVAAAGVLSAGAAAATSPGTVDTTIVVTFDRLVTVMAAAVPTYHAGALPGGAADIANFTCVLAPVAGDASTPRLTLTITCDNQEATPTLPNAEIRFPVSSLKDAKTVLSAASATKLTSA